MDPMYCGACGTCYPGYCADGSCPANDGTCGCADGSTPANVKPLATAPPTEGYSADPTPTPTADPTTAAPTYQTYQCFKEYNVGCAVGGGDIRNHVEGGYSSDSSGTQGGYTLLYAQQACLAISGCNRVTYNPATGHYWTSSKVPDVSESYPASLHGLSYNTDCYESSPQGSSFANCSTGTFVAHGADNNRCLIVYEVTPPMNGPSMADLLRKREECLSAGVQ